MRAAKKEGSLRMPEFTFVGSFWKGVVLRPMRRGRQEKISKEGEGKGKGRGGRRRERGEQEEQGRPGGRARLYTQALTPDRPPPAEITGSSGGGGNISRSSYSISSRGSGSYKCFPAIHSSDDAKKEKLFFTLAGLKRSERQGSGDKDRGPGGSRFLLHAILYLPKQYQNQNVLDK